MFVSRGKAATKVELVFFGNCWLGGFRDFQTRPNGTVRACPLCATKRLALATSAPVENVSQLTSTELHEALGQKVLCGLQRLACTKQPVHSTKCTAPSALNAGLCSIFCRAALSYVMPRTLPEFRRVGGACPDLSRFRRSKEKVLSSDGETC